MNITYRKIVAFCILGVLLLSFAGCADAHNMQKTELHRGQLFPPSGADIGDDMPCMDLKCTTEPMPVDQAVMTLYFATTIREDQIVDERYSWVIYVSNLNKGNLRTSFPDQSTSEDYVPPLADYRNVEGYYILAEFHGVDEISKLTAKWRRFRPVKYNYSQQITIPAECLTGESGTLSIHAYDLLEWYDEDTKETVYAIGANPLGCRIIWHIKYEVKDGQVWFDLSDCKKN